LSDSIRGLAIIRSGAYEGATGKASAGKAMDAALYRIFGTSGEAGGKAVLQGYASCVDERGNVVATLKIQITRQELRRLSSALDNLTRQFKALKNGRGDIGRTVENLRRTVAEVIAGDRLKDTDSLALEGIVNDLPIRTNALQLTVKDVALMEKKDFDRFIELLESSRMRVQTILDDTTKFANVNALIEGSEVTFLELQDLP
jgi:hypothetical protein